jgi:hypothetical protein
MMNFLGQLIEEVARKRISLGMKKLDTCYTAMVGMVMNIGVRHKKRFEVIGLSMVNKIIKSR